MALVLDESGRKPLLRIENSAVTAELVLIERSIMRVFFGDPGVPLRSPTIRQRIIALGGGEYTLGSIMSAISTLRAKIRGMHLDATRVIQTVEGEGYRFNNESSAQTAGRPMRPERDMGEYGERQDPFAGLPAPVPVEVHRTTFDPKDPFKDLPEPDPDSIARGLAHLRGEPAAQAEAVTAARLAAAHMSAGRYYVPASAPPPRPKPQEKHGRTSFKPGKASGWPSSKRRRHAWLEQGLTPMRNGRVRGPELRSRGTAGRQPSIRYVA